MKSALLGLLLIVLPFMIFGQDQVSEVEVEKKNQISVFFGAISNKDANAFAIGLDDQYRVNKIIGAGALVDYASGSIASLLIGPALYLHAWHFEFTIAPKIELSGSDVAWPLRLGAAYQSELPKGVSISPVVYFDTERNEESALVYGLSLNFKR